MDFTDVKYNGWTNKATWLVSLYADNDYGSYQHKVETLKDAFATGELPNAINELIDMVVEVDTPEQLRQLIDEQSGYRIASDLLGWWVACRYDLPLHDWMDRNDAMDWLREYRLACAAIDRGSISEHWSEEAEEID
jgi:hypothetical protein